MSVSYMTSMWARFKRSPLEQVKNEWIDHFIDRSLAEHDEIERIAKLASPERPDRQQSGPDQVGPLRRVVRVGRQLHSYEEY
jgi:hypothetical protein